MFNLVLILFKILLHMLVTLRLSRIRLRTMSKYTLNFEGDLKADEIRKEVADIFQVVNTDNKSHIKVNTEKLKRDWEVDVKLKVALYLSVPFLSQIFKFGPEVDAGVLVKEFTDKLESSKDLSDQLNILNTQIQNQTKFVFEGNKIVPKSLEVAKMQSSALKKTIVFERIKLVYFEATYNEKFTLSTNNFAEWNLW